MGADDRSDVPQRLLQRLDDLGDELERRGDSLALIGLGSVGQGLDRLDEHSDLDFFVIVEDGAKERYLDSIDWFEALAPVAFSYVNTVDGRKVLFADGLFAEYAVFTLGELGASSYPPGRLVWARSDAPGGLEDGRAVPQPSRLESAEHQLNEALTKLYVGLHRDARGERLAATRLIQVHAIDRLIRVLELTVDGAAVRQDAFAIERGVERRFDPEALPLAAMVPGYAENRKAATAILDWIEARFEVDPTLAGAVRALAEPS